MVRRVSVATATSIQSEYFNRKTSKADFERILDTWQEAVQKTGKVLHPNVIDEFNSRIKSAIKAPSKAKLNLSNCEIDDIQLTLLIETLAKKPVIAKLDLSENIISNEGVSLLIKLLRGQAKLVKTVHKDKRLTAAFLAEVTLENNSISLEPKLTSKLLSLCDSLKVANAQSHIRAKYIDFNAPDIILSPFLIKMWFDVVGKLDHDRISKAFESADISEKAPLGYDELEMILIHGLILRGALPPLNDEVRRSSIICDISPIQHILEEVENIHNSELRERQNNQNEEDLKTLLRNEENLYAENLNGTISDVEDFSNGPEKHVSNDSNKDVSPISKELEPINDENNNGTSCESTSGGGFGSNNSNFCEQPEIHNGTTEESFVIESPPNSSVAKAFLFNVETFQQPEDSLHQGNNEHLDVFKDPVPPSNFVRKLESSPVDKQLCLENINISSANFSAHVTTSQFRTLRVLILRNNHISDVSKLQIHRCMPNLTDIDLAYNSIGKKIFDTDLPKRLQRLDISNNQLADISGVLMCVDLKELNVSNNQVAALYGLPTKIIRLDISHNRLNSIASLRSLSMCTMMNTLVVHHNPVLKSLPNVKVFFKSLFANLRELDDVKVSSEKPHSLDNPWGLQSPGRSTSANSSVTSDFRSPISTFLSPQKLSRSEQKKNDEVRTKQKAVIASKTQPEQPVNDSHSGKKKVLRLHEIDNLTKRLYEPKGAANDPRRSDSKSNHKPAPKRKPAGEAKTDPEHSWAGKSKMMKYINEWANHATEELERITEAFRLAESFLNKEELLREDFDQYSETIDLIKEYRVADLPNRVKFALEAQQKLHNEKIPDISSLLEHIEKSTLLLQQIQTIIMFAVDGNVKFREGLDMVMSSKLGQYVNENVLKPLDCDYAASIMNIPSSPQYAKPLLSSEEFIYKDNDAAGFDYSNPLNNRELDKDADSESSSIMEKMRVRIAAKYLPPDVNTDSPHDISNNLSIFAKNPLKEHKTPRNENQDQLPTTRDVSQRKADSILDIPQEGSCVDSFLTDSPLSIPRGDSFVSEVVAPKESQNSVKFETAPQQTNESLPMIQKPASTSLQENLMPRENEQIDIVMDNNSADCSQSFASPGSSTKLSSSDRSDLIIKLSAKDRLKSRLEKMRKATGE